jgi:hypothetical protein
MPRTTLDLDTLILAELRRRAAAESKSMGQVASELLAMPLREESRAEPRPLNWARKDMGPFKVDLEDKEALWRLLDEDERRQDNG